MKCQFCTMSETASYVCPQCTAPYCSVACYKSRDHLECSELFYKRCAEEQMRPGVSRKSDVETVEKALRRHLKQREEDDESEFSARFSDIDITDADSVMKVLTVEERETFSNLLASKRIADFVPSWKPWWHEDRKLIEEVEPKDASNGMQDYKPQRKMARNKIGGRKVHSLKPSTGPNEKDSELREKSAAGIEEVEETIMDGSRPKRTSIVDVRYKPRKSFSLETREEQKNAEVELSTQSIEASPCAQQNVSLDDEIFNHPKLISSVFRTKSANLINLITSFAFTARYYNGDFEELVEEAGETLCSTSLIFEQKECHEVPLAISDVLSRSVVLENSDRVSLIKDVLKICHSKQFTQRALIEIGALLKAYGKCLRSDTDPDPMARKQRAHKFRYKVYFYIDWIDRSFPQFREHSTPLVDLLLAESKLDAGFNNKFKNAVTFQS